MHQQIVIAGWHGEFPLLSWPDHLVATEPVITPILISGRREVDIADFGAGFVYESKLRRTDAA